MFLVLGEGFFDYDGSWAPYSYYRIAPEYGFPEVTGDPDTLFFPNALIRAMVDNTQYGWLPRVTIRHSGGEIVAGAELRIHRSIHWGRLNGPISFPCPYPRTTVTMSIGEPRTSSPSTPMTSGSSGRISTLMLNRAVRIQQVPAVR